MSQQLIFALLVGCGGAVGSICRYSVSQILRGFTVAFPCGTLTVNVLGCFVIALVTAAAERGGVSPEVRLALATGFCGGFTTMSSMIYETAGMLRSGETIIAMIYVGATLLLSMVAFIGGTSLYKLVMR